MQLTEDEFQNLKRDAERFRFLRRESMIRPTLGKKRQYFVSFPTIEASPTNLGIAYNDNFSAAVDKLMAIHQTMEEARACQIASQLTVSTR